MNYYREYWKEMNKASFGRIKKELSSINVPTAFDMEKQLSNPSIYKGTSN
jgi:hypothetical protein